MKFHILMNSGDEAINALMLDRIEAKLLERVDSEVRNKWLECSAHLAWSTGWHGELDKFCYATAHDRQTVEQTQGYRNGAENVVVSLPELLDIIKPSKIDVSLSNQRESVVVKDGRVIISGITFQHEDILKLAVAIAKVRR